MESERQVITLGGERAQTVIHAVQGESQAQTLAFRIVDSQKSVMQVPTTAKALFYVDKGAGNQVQLEGSITSGGEITVPLSLQATTAPGNHPCLLQVYDNDTDLWRSSMTLSVSPNPASSIPNRPEFQVLTRILLDATSVLRELQDATDTLQELEGKFLTGIQAERFAAKSVGSGPVRAATDGARWYIADAITDKFFYSDDLQDFQQGSFPKFGNIYGMAASEGQLCVIGNQYIQISENRGQSFVYTEIPADLKAAFIGLRRYGSGFLAVPNYDDVRDAVYIAYSGGQWTVESAGRFGRTRDFIPCGNKLARACSAHDANGNVAFTSLRIYEDLNGQYTDLSIPGNRIPAKLGWDGSGLHLICADGTTYYSSDLRTLKATGQLSAPGFSGSTISDIVCTAGICAAVLDSDTIIYAGPGQAWTSLSFGTGNVHQAAAAYGGIFLFAGPEFQAVCGLSTASSNYTEKLETLRQNYDLLTQQVRKFLTDSQAAVSELEQSKATVDTWLEESQGQFQQQLGMKIRVQRDDAGLPNTLQDGEIILVYGRGAV